MSKNYDMIATVDIDIATPIVDDTSFDNLLIMGPAPKTGAKSPARVGVYSDISEVEDAGFVTSGADADPVGLAASVAFAQSPRPTAVYIAVQQLSEGAVVAGQTIKDTNAAVAQYAGKKEGLTGCAISFKESARKLSMVLDGPITGVKNTGLFDMLAALIRRWMPHYTIAQIMQVLDAIIVLIGAGVFGITYALYALIAIYSVSKVSDGIIEGMKYSKVAYIISDKSKEIAAAILKEMDRGVTALDARGMYSGNRKDVLFCVVSRKEIAQLKELIVGHDAQAFVIVSDAREVLGEGFIEYRQ